VPDSVLDDVAVAVPDGGVDTTQPETRAARRAGGKARGRTAAERQAAREQKAADYQAQRAAVAERKAARQPVNRVAAAVRAALASAATLDAEIEALAAGAPDRARDVILRRLGYGDWPPPTLESLGAKYGVTRERVRQLGAARVRDLREVRPALPIAAWAIRILSSLGGVATDEAFRAALADAGLVAGEAAVRALQTLSNIQLVEPIRYHERARCWFDGLRWVELVASGMFDETLHRTLKRARATLRRTGAVSALRLADVPPLAPAHVANLALGGRPWALHDGYVVWRETRPTVVATATTRVLAAVGDVSLHALRRALRRTQPRPIRLPVAVIAEVLKTRPEFVVANGRVASRIPLDTAALLRQPRLTVIEAARQRDGYLTAQEILAVLSASGYDSSWAMALIQSPLFERIGRGRYALVGRFDTVSPAPRSYGRSLLPGRYASEGGDVHLRYWVNAITRRGALRLPNRAAAAVANREGDWQLYTNSRDSAPVGTLSLRGGYVFDFAPWLRASGATDGDQIALVLEPETQRVVVSIVPASDAPARRPVDPQRVAALESRLAERDQRRVERETVRAARAQRREERSRLANERAQVQEAREAARAAAREAAWNAPLATRPALPTLALDTVRCYVPGDAADLLEAGDILIAVFGDAAPTPDGGLHGVRCRLTLVDQRTRSFAFVREAIMPAAVESLRPVSLNEAIRRVPTLARVLAATYATLG
jgi:hypothetical protein